MPTEETKAHKTDPFNLCEKIARGYADACGKWAQEAEADGNAASAVVWSAKRDTAQQIANTIEQAGLRRARMSCAAGHELEPGDVERFVRCPICNSQTRVVWPSPSPD